MLFVYKKGIPAIILVLLTYTSNAQFAVKRIGFTYNVSFGYREIKNNHDLWISDVPKYCNGGSLAIQCKLFSELYFETGLTVSFIGYNASYNGKILISTGNGWPSFQDGEIKAKYNFTYTDIPFVLGINFFPQSKVSLNVKGGIVINQLISSSEKVIQKLGKNGYIDISSSYTKRYDNIEKSDVSWKASIGVMYRINKSVRLTVNPFFTRQIKPLETAGSTKTWLYNTGLEMGIMFRK